MRREELQDEMIFNCFNALQNDLTDFGGFEDRLSSILITEIGNMFDMGSNDAELDSGCVVRFFEEEECVLVVEVIA